MSAALAYVNWGRWVAECPADGCHDAVELSVAPRDQSMTCAVGHTSPVQWPGDDTSVAAITAALVVRPDESTRAWFPAGHPMAVAGGYPVDQTPAELQAETDKHEQARSEQRAQMVDIASLIAGAGPVTLADLGLVLNDDGTLIPSGKVD